jgi:predicted nucleotidyltransferase
MDPHKLGQLEELAVGVFRDQPVVFAYLFGSRASGQDRTGSDWDVAVYVEPALDPAARFELRLTLGARLEAGLREEVDLVVLNDAPLQLAGRIIQSRTVIYSRDEPARVRYESLTMRMFMDFEIHAKPFRQRRLDAIARGEH